MTEKCERCGSLMYQPLLGPREDVCKLCQRHAIEGVSEVKYHERLEVADIAICTIGANTSQQVHGYLNQNYCTECGAPFNEVKP